MAKIITSNATSSGSSGAITQLNADWNSEYGVTQILNKPGPVSTTNDGLMSADDKIKLNGVQEGAEQNAVDSVSGKTGAVVLTKADVGLNSVDNTSDLNKPISTATQTALNAKASTSVATTSASGLMSATDKSKIDGVATGANNYTHPTNHPPSIITQDTSNRFVTDAEKSTWNGKAAGDHTHTDLHTHTNKSILDATTASFTLAQESKLTGVETGAEVNNISDVNATDLTDGGASTLHYHTADRARANHTGTQSADTIIDGTTNKVLTATNKTNYDTAYTHSQSAHAPSNAEANQTVTAGAGMNFTATNSDVTVSMGTPSTLTTATINNTTTTSHTHAVTFPVTSVASKTGAVLLVKGDVGLGSVDNTSDASKPVSTAQQTALNLKANLVSPTFTGTPLAPTATAGTNTTQIATTAFVQSAMSSAGNGDMLKSVYDTNNNGVVDYAHQGVNGTDYTTSKLRNVRLYAEGATLPTLADGEILLVYSTTILP